jgi:hypothetical protein
VTTVGAEWAAERGYDIHLVRGQPGRQLDTLLLLLQDPQPHKFASERPRPTDVRTVAFEPRFLHGPAANNKIEAHRVRIDVETGLVEGLTAASLTEVDNFLVDALVTVDRPGGPVMFPAPQIRVHVHAGVSDAGLAPELLTVREGANGQSFSVLATFIDGTVGDVTTDPGIRWSGGSAAVRVDPLTGALTANAVSGPVPITVTLPASLGGLVRTAEVEVLPAWSALPAANRRATRMSGPNVADADLVPNVLILGDGFTADRAAQFEELAHRLVEQLRTSRLTSPFDLLSGSINYWRAFVESPESGGTVLSELYQEPRPTVIRGLEVPRPRPPDEGATERFSLDELIHEVGLPLPEDSTKSDATLLTHWLAVFGVNASRVTPPKVGEPSLFDQWRALHNRTLALNERNTALGLAAGGRPQVNEERPLRLLTFHPRRTTRAHLDQFLATLVDEFTGVDVGRHWNASPTPPLPVGKDQERIVVLSHGGPRAGARTAKEENDRSVTELIAVALSPYPTVLLGPIGATPFVEVLPRAFPRRPDGKPDIVTDVVGTTAHEIAHGIGLGDEYGNRADVLTDRQKQEIREFANLQLREDLGGDPLRADAVRWRWPRLRLAARITDRPIPQGGNEFLVPLDQRHVGQFHPPDLVRLRQNLPLGLISAELEVRAVDTAARRVRVHDPSGTLAVTFVLFGAGSVLCAPVPAPPSAGSDEFAELMAQPVRERINSTNGPLNAPETFATRPCEPLEDPNIIQPGTNWPGGIPPRPPKYSAWIIGLYEGGGRQACTVMHPAGVCLMRANLVPDLDPGPATSENAGFIYPFCLVCRYILVDRIDAARHAELEARVIKTKLYPFAE